MDDEFFNDYNGVDDLEYEEADDDFMENNVENKYLTAKAILQSAPKEALRMLNEIIVNDIEPFEWKFKSLKNLVKAYVNLGNFSEALNQYKNLICFVEKSPTIFRHEKSITGLLDKLSRSSLVAEQIVEFYTFSLSIPALEKMKRLQFVCKLQLSIAYMKRKKYDKSDQMIQRLHKGLEEAMKTGDISSKRDFIEVLAIEAELCQANSKHIRILDIYNKTMALREEVSPNPRLMAFICECAGKAFMLVHRWESARDAFYITFKCYDEAGMVDRIEALNYLLITSMLSGWKMDPFASKETLPYRSYKQLALSTSIMRAFTACNVPEFDSLMSKYQENVSNNIYLSKTVNIFKRVMRIYAVPFIIKPFSNVSIQYLVKKLQNTEAEVEEILCELIRDNKIAARINQISGTLELETTEEQKGSDETCYELIQRWAACAETLGQMATRCNFTNTI